MTRSILLILALGVLVAACATDGLPDAPLGTDGGAAGTCPEGTEDCNDTPGTGAQPLPVHDAGVSDPGGDGTSSGAVAGTGLTVTEALGTDVEGTLAVGGFLVANDSGTFLCEALAESFPPQCGGSRIPVEGVALEEYPVEEEGSVRWTNDLVVLFGEVIDGVLVISDTVAG